MAELLDNLDQLESLDLLSLLKSDPEREYAFRHVFTQESVYGSLLRSERRQLHQYVGEALENALAGSEESDTALVLAYHFEQSGDKERALKYLQQAAIDAYGTYANEEAKTLYNRALALLERDDYANRWDILLELERILDRLGQ